MCLFTCTALTSFLTLTAGATSDSIYLKDSTEYALKQSKKLLSQASSRLIIYLPLEINQLRLFLQETFVYMKCLAASLWGSHGHISTAARLPLVGVLAT